MKRFIFKIQSTRAITFFYFFLLLYTIAALVWWGIALLQQSWQITLFEKGNLQLSVDSVRQPVEYHLLLNDINNREIKRKQQYAGEGITFLLVILIGASFVYRATRKQIKLSRQQHNFMMAVTHELKSPIAAAQLNIETLQKRKLDEATQHKLIDNTLSEISRLNHLCNNMLLASQLESRQFTVVKESLNLSQLVNKCITDNKRRQPLRRIIEQVQPGIWIKGDELMVTIALNNLIENAAKYSPKENNIYVKLSADKNSAHLLVEDEGSGINEVEKKKIFTKFYRVGNENTRQAKGTGLGLYLTKKIAQQHHGEITVSNHQPHGSVFEITLPCIKES